MHLSKRQGTWFSKQTFSKMAWTELVYGTLYCNINYFSIFLCFLYERASLMNLNTVLPMKLNFTSFLFHNNCFPGHPCISGPSAMRWHGRSWKTAALCKKDSYIFSTFLIVFVVCLRRPLCQCNHCDLFLQSFNVVLRGVYQSGAPSWWQIEKLVFKKSEPEAGLRSLITVIWNTSHWHVISLVDYLLIWLLQRMLCGIICEILNLHTPIF